MSLEEEDKLFNLGLVGSRAHFQPIVRLGVHLGARLGELMAIKWADINLSTKPFSAKLRSKGQDVKVEVRPNHVLIPKSKNGEPRNIPLSNVAKEILRTFSAMKPDSSTCSQILTPAGRTRMSVRRSGRHAGRREFRI